MQEKQSNNFTDPCEVGFYKDSSMAVCEKCPVNHYTNLKGSGLCYQCQEGSAANPQRSKCGKLYSL